MAAESRQPYGEAAVCQCCYMWEQSTIIINLIGTCCLYKTENLAGIGGNSIELGGLAYSNSMWPRAAIPDSAYPAAFGRPSGPAPRPGRGWLGSMCVRASAGFYFRALALPSTILGRALALADIPNTLILALAK